MLNGRHFPLWPSLCLHPALSPAAAAAAAAAVTAAVTATAAAAAAWEPWELARPGLQAAKGRGRAQGQGWVGEEGPGWAGIIIQGWEGAICHGNWSGGSSGIRTIRDITAWGYEDLAGWRRGWGGGREQLGHEEEGRFEAGVARDRSGRRLGAKL